MNILEACKEMYSGNAIKRSDNNLIHFISTWSSILDEGKTHLCVDVTMLDEKRNNKRPVPYRKVMWTDSDVLSAEWEVYPMPKS